MVYFQTKNLNLGKFWRALDGNMLVYLWPFGIFGTFYGHLVHFVFIWYILCSFGTFCVHLVYFVFIWYILCSFGIFCVHLVHFVFIWYIFPVWVSCTEKNREPASGPLAKAGANPTVGAVLQGQRSRSDEVELGSDVAEVGVVGGGHRSCSGRLLLPLFCRLVDLRAGFPDGIFS
jgi:hypothetical protein